jgi:sulfate transport system ATP-binding protein
LITVQNISKRFGDYPALHDVSLTIEPGEFIALLGPSGSGKTTLLRIIAGLEFQDKGQVLFDGEDVSTRKVAERGVGFVFQHYALFKHMTVAENVAFGLSVRKRKDRPSKVDIKARAEELLGLVQLGGLGNRYPAQLSGGQRQRVALARALAVEPQLLLLDEPFGALDAKVRKDLRRWLRGLHEQMGLTSIFVTHDQEEALELADRIVVMDHGVIEQVGTAEQVYMEPASPFVSDFVGEINRVDVTVTNGLIRINDRLLDIPANGTDGPAQWHFRPHDVELANADADGLPIIVSNLFRKGGKWRVEGQCGVLDRVIEIDLDAGITPPNLGEQLVVRPIKSRIFSTNKN